MKRGFYDNDDDDDKSYCDMESVEMAFSEYEDENSVSVAEKDEEEGEEQQEAEAKAVEHAIAPACAKIALARDDRPYLLPSISHQDPTGLYFDYHPQGKQVDPVATGSMVTGISPFGSTLGTLEYNLRHAIEKRDETRTVACLTECFRHFVLLNRPLRRVVPRHLERDTRLDMRMPLGPFANPVALGMHQRLLVMLMGIAVRQVGVGTPTMYSFLLDEWKMYERVLFHRPTLALAKLLGMGATLCHCKKDASVAYTRHVFDDTSKMREWRNEVLKNPDILSTYIPDATDAYKARKMLLCNKVYFNNRLRLRRYQTVCIGTPHPEYMCQGGCMHRSHVLKLVDTVKQSLPNYAGALALALIQDVEDAMIYLASHVNNMYDREAFETLQVDLQIFLYLFRRVVSEENLRNYENPDSLLHTSQLIVGSAANHITEAYAGRVWVSPPDIVDLIKYGVRGEPRMTKAGRGSKKRVLTLSHLMDTFHPEVVPKIHEWAPPSVVRDDDNISRELEASIIQRHPGVQSLRFLFGLYRLHYMWSKCTSSKVLTANRDLGERIELDREFFDIKQPYRVLYQCPTTGVCATEVHLQGHAGMELVQSKSVACSGPNMRVERIQTTDMGEAEFFADHLCRPDDTGGQKAIKAVLIGPWAVHEMGRLAQEVAHYQTLKEVLGVHPDMVYVKKMMLLDYSSVLAGTSNTTHILGRMYAWVVYIPKIHTDDKHVLLTIDELKRMAKQDAYLAKAAKSILRPKNLVRTVAVMKRVCGEFCQWTVGDNYVSFHVSTEDATIVLKDIRLHTIAETLLGQVPDYRFTTTADSDRGTKSRTMDLIQTLVEKCRNNSQYAAVNIELAHCHDLLNQI